MKIRCSAVIMAAVCVVGVFSGCGTVIGKNENADALSKAEIVTAKTESKVEEEISSVDEHTKQYDETKITAKNIDYTKFEKSVEAEKGQVSGKASVKKIRKGFSGTGYVSRITADSEWQVIIDLPESQYYNVSVIVGADKAVKNGLALNGVKVSEFTTGTSKKFEAVSFNNIYLEKGKNKIAFTIEDGGIDIDKVTVKASDEISKLDLKLTNAQLTNKNADYNAQALYSYICENYGKSVILGQHDTVGTTAESSLIYSTTGKYPAIRFGDMTMFTDDTYTNDSEIPCAEQWYKDGGIVGYMWHWNAPMNGSGYYADDTKFDIKKAVTKLDIATKTPKEIQALQKSGKISEECAALVEDIDKISTQLAKLRDEGVAVLWRPLHEASNGYFWWGKDAESYKWLWKLMYNRQTKYHKLNNLIWVWSAQNANWYVGDSYCDIMSVDVYDQGSKDGQVNSLLFLRSISKNKPIAMSECGTMPSIQSIADQKAMWSYIGQWGGNFLMDDSGKLSEENNSSADLITMYNNNLTITRDELPDFNHMANDIKVKKEEAEKENPAVTTTAKTEKSDEKTTSKTSAKKT